MPVFLKIEPWKYVLAAVQLEIITFGETSTCINHRTGSNDRIQRTVLIENQRTEKTITIRPNNKFFLSSRGGLEAELWTDNNFLLLFYWTIRQRFIY